MSADLARVFEKIRYAAIPGFDHPTFDHPNARTEVFGETPLHLITVWNDLDSARILLDHGAEIDVPGETGFTALHYAILHGHLALAELLIARGASLTYRNEDNHDARDMIEILILIEPSQSAEAQALLDRLP